MEHKFYEQFRVFMKRYRITYEAMGQGLNISKSTANKYVRGELEFPEYLLRQACLLLFKLTETQAQEVVDLYKDFWVQKQPKQEGPSKDEISIAKITLRPQVPYFTGRGEEIRQILKELQPGCIVTLCGPSGIGKTALALQVVWQLILDNEQPHPFSDGIFFHDFYREPQAEIVLEKIVHAFGEEPRPTAAAAAENVLAHRRVLLVLDGAENADNLGKVLEVQGSQCGVLITTTHAHDAEGILYILETLPPENAQDVLKSWSKGKTIDEKTAEEICALAGYLPLALRIAGDFMVQRRISADIYLDLLRTTELSALHLTDRKHKSIPILLGLSIQPLSKTEREVLAVAALLAFSPFQWEVVAAALAFSKSETYLLLAVLTDYSLLERVEASYQLTHRLIHIYARQELKAPLQSIERLAEYYTAFAKQQQALELAGYVRLDAERPHLIAVLSACQQQNQWTLTKELASVIDAYLDLQGHWTERVMTLQSGLVAARALNDTPAEGEFLGKLGEVHFQQGRWDEAVHLCQESLRLFQELGDGARKAQLLSRLGIIYFNQNRWDEAIASFEESLRMWQELNDQHGEGQAYNGLCGVYRMLGRWHESISQGEKALQIFQELGDRLGESRVLTNLGNVYADQGRLAEAAQRYKDSLRLKRELGDRSGEEMALNNLALVYSDQGRWPDAIECYQQALALCRKLGTRQGEDSVLNNLGDIYMDQGNWSKAIELYQESLGIAREMHNRGSEAQTLNNLGMVYADQGRWPEAIALYQESLRIKRDLHDQLNEGHTLTNLGKVYAEQGKIAEAIRLHTKSLQIAHELEDRLGKARTLLHLGQANAKQNDWTNAAKHYAESLAIFRQSGVRHGEARVLLSLGTVDYDQSHFDEAEIRYDEALLIFREIGARHDEGLTLMKKSFLKEKQNDKGKTLAFAQEALTKLNPGSPEYERIIRQLKSMAIP